MGSRLAVKNKQKDQSRSMINHYEIESSDLARTQTNRPLKVLLLAQHLANGNIQHPTSIIHGRIEMLLVGGAEVTVAGFRRTSESSQNKIANQNWISIK
jgi:hypothetical protein